MTTDKTITRRLFNSGVKHARRYLVQVRFSVGPETLAQLAGGARISASGGKDYLTAPCEVELLSAPPPLPPPAVPIHPLVPHSWLRMTLTEGRYHQVRKMVSVVRHNSLRLVRESIEAISIGDMQPGEVRELTREEFYRQLKLD